MTRWPWVMIGVIALVLVGTAVYPWHGAPKRTVAVLRLTCLDIMKQQALAMALYESDGNDRFPQRDAWVDALMPYTKNESIFHCPSEKGRWGYAFNGALDRASVNKLPSVGDVPVTYDSVNPTKNASDLFKSLPARPRHTRNVVSYADGHADVIRGPAPSTSASEGPRAPASQ